MVIGHFGVGTGHSEGIRCVGVGILLDEFPHVLDGVEKHLLLIVVFPHTIIIISKS